MKGEYKMRLKIGNKVLSEGTSKCLRGDLKLDHGELTFEKAQKILDSMGQIDVQYEEENIHVNKGFIKLEVPVTKTFYIARKEENGWKKIYDLCVDRDGLVYQIFEDKFSFDNKLAEMKKTYDEYKKVEDEIKKLNEKSDELYNKYSDMRSEIKEKLQSDFNIH